MLCCIVAVSACVFSPESEEYPLPGSGETKELRMSVSYRPLAGVITRSAGDALRHLDNLWVLAFDASGKLQQKSNVSSLTESEKDCASSGISGVAESTFCHSEFAMQLPLGAYRIYAAAGLDLSGFSGTEDELKSISFAWNASDISSNAQMFGFFTDDDSIEVPSEAPLIVIGKNTSSLHAWVKRAASKVTVTYDASELKDNIYIYLKSVQVLDIPASCLLGKPNTPSSSAELIHEGEKISYSTSDDIKNWPYISKGKPVYEYDGGHTEYSEALYFFENNQGTGEKHGYHPSDESWNKDRKAYGTYIEVKGYYVNRTADNASQGPITYRFMLGKDVSTDFNAERSNHYKITLRFINDANDPDWHIEYVPEQPELSIPDPLYISYVPNESVNVPVVVRGGDASTRVTANIIDSHWWGDKGHKYSYCFKETYDGCLSLALTGGSLSSASERQSDFNSKNNLSYSPSSVLADRCIFSIPVYTRGLTLGSSLSGYNYFPHDTRTGTIRFSATIGGKQYTKDVRIVQVKRVVNPAGVWREATSTKPFNFRLMELNEDDDSANGAVHRQFYPTISDGPWTAHIEQGSDWIQIAPTGSGAWGTKDVTGGTSSEVRFDVRPASTCADGVVREGVIKVTYNNNTCIHYFFVSQGLGDVPMAVNVTYPLTTVYDKTSTSHTCYWMNRNMKYAGVPCDNPLMEGGLFRWGNASQAIKPEDAQRSGYGFNIEGYSTGKTHWMYNGGDVSFTGIWHPERPTGFRYDEHATYKSRFYGDRWPAKYADWTALQSLPRYYGVLYGEESTGTATNTTDAYTYINPGDVKGMQGLFVWDRTNARHLFFPIGASGYGHRKGSDLYNVAWGGDGNVKRDVLKYAQRSLEMPTATAEKLPMLYDLWMRKGAIYWYEENEFYTANKESYAHDINYYTYDLNTYGANPVTMAAKGASDPHSGKACRSAQWSDACFVRCVHY